MGTCVAGVNFHYSNNNTTLSVFCNLSLLIVYSSHMNNNWIATSKKCIFKIEKYRNVSFLPLKRNFIVRPYIHIDGHQFLYSDP